MQGVAVSHLTSFMKLPKRFTFAFVASMLFCTAGSVHALEEGHPGGTWPKSWPRELEPLRKQAWTWVSGQVLQTSYHIPFANREEFDRAWPHILKLKSKGASLTLLRGPHVRVRPAKTAGILIMPPISAGVTRLVLVVDGNIVDLNRIPFPADTPIIDKRFDD